VLITLCDRTAVAFIYKHCIFILAYTRFASDLYCLYDHVFIYSIALNIFLSAVQCFVL